MKFFELERQKFLLFPCIAQFIPLLTSRCSGWAKDAPVPLQLFTSSWASAHAISLGAQLKMQILFFFGQQNQTGNFLYFKRRNLLFVTRSEKNGCLATFQLGTKSNLSWSGPNPPWVFFWPYFSQLKPQLRKPWFPVQVSRLTHHSLVIYFYIHHIFYRLPLSEIFWLSAF